jgi:hypothetical protein
MRRMLSNLGKDRRDLDQSMAVLPDKPAIAKGGCRKVTHL